MNSTEAAQKWCPFSAKRYQILFEETTVDTDLDRRGQSKLEIVCISNRCMAWRGDVHDGYCGLAGDPK